MSKKLLLRRPKCTINESTNYPSSPPKTTELELRTTSFKDEIQCEIELLDKEYLITQNEANNEQEDEQINCELFDKIKCDNKCTAISVWNIDERLLPSKDSSKLKGLEKSSDAPQSTKTVKIFDRDNQVKQCVIQSAVYCHNLYEQTEASLPAPCKAVPRHIIIIQIAALLKRQLSDNMNRDVGCTIVTVPKHKSNNFQAASKFEIVLYENNHFQDYNAIKPYEISNLLQQRLVKSDHEGVYHHQDDETEDDISAVDVSMMECHMTGKHQLCLSAHSISEVPNLRNIFPDLTVIDLSYNKFKSIPTEVLDLPYLEELNIRNNPIQRIPDTISSMNNLRVFVCSYTHITTVPSSVFLCVNLQELDISYNNITTIPHVYNSQKLKTLNLSGNPIRYFKKSFGCLNLTNLFLENTFAHPLFWTAGEFLPAVVDRSWNICDLCGQQLSDFSGSSLSFSRKFNHLIPILLSFCGQLCRDSFIS